MGYEKIRDKDSIEKIEIAVETILNAMGVDINDPNVVDTPRRVARYFMEFSEVNRELPAMTVFPANLKNKQLLIVGGLEVRSLCSHHLAPFTGKCFIGYYPEKVELGLSKFQRILDHFANRLQLQERLTDMVRSYLEELLGTRVHVLIIAEHTCMTVRGVKAHEASTVSYSGPEESAATFLSLTNK